MYVFPFLLTDLPWLGTSYPNPRLLSLTRLPTYHMLRCAVTTLQAPACYILGLIMVYNNISLSSCLQENTIFHLVTDTNGKRKKNTTTKKQTQTFYRSKYLKQKLLFPSVLASLPAFLGYDSYNITILN